MTGQHFVVPNAALRHKHEHLLTLFTVFSIVAVGGIPYSIGEDKVMELLRSVGNVVSFR
jgi:hypothetical protein